MINQVDEYAGSDIDSAVHSYRSGILAELADTDYVSAFDRWRAVRDATFKKFRDGTMDVYIPLDNDNNDAPDPAHTRLCQVSDTDGVAEIAVLHPSFTRKYRKTNCILGTVFQDQAYFTVRRKQAEYPDLLREPLTVHLACGYDDDDGSERGKAERYRFESLYNNPKVYSAVLYPNQVSVKFPVPKLSDPFDSQDESDEPRLREKRVRCSIIGAVYGLNPTPTDTGLPQYQDGITDPERLTAIVEVSDHRDGMTLHTLMSSVIFNPDSDERIQKMGSALYYTYFLGWYTGFIKMPYFSIHDSLSALPYSVPGESADSVIKSINNRERLRRYQLLASLFIDESDQRFDTEHFGFLTPKEAWLKYENDYNSRFKAYFGNVLGVFLQDVPPQYRQR